MSLRTFSIKWDVIIGTHLLSLSWIIGCSQALHFVTILLKAKSALHQLVHRDVTRRLRRRRTCQNPLSWIIGCSQALHFVTILLKAKSALHQLVHRDVTRRLCRRRTCQNPLSWIIGGSRTTPHPALSWISSTLTECHLRGSATVGSICSLSGGVNEKKK